MVRPAAEKIKEANLPRVPLGSKKGEASEWLCAEYAALRSRNQSFSLRAFARRVGIPSGRLSQLMHRKRNITPKLAAQIADRLAFTPTDRQAFIDLTIQQRQQRQRAPTAAPVQRDVLDDDVFAMIADWYHFAILNLVTTSDFVSDRKWIARRLGVSIIEVKIALERLLRLGLLEEKSGRLLRSCNALSTPSGVPSAALRRSHRQSLAKAAAALEELPVSERFLSSMTIASSPAAIKVVQRLVGDLFERVDAMLGATSRQEVYELNVQFIPVTKPVKATLKRKKCTAATLKH